VALAVRGERGSQRDAGPRKQESGRVALADNRRRKFELYFDV
jgi:hypothetical protein